MFQAVPVLGAAFCVVRRSLFRATYLFLVVYPREIGEIGISKSCTDRRNSQRAPSGRVDKRPGRWAYGRASSRRKCRFWTQVVVSARPYIRLIYGWWQRLPFILLYFGHKCGQCAECGWALGACRNTRKMAGPGGNRLRTLTLHTTGQAPLFTLPNNLKSIL